MKQIGNNRTKDAVAEKPFFSIILPCHNSERYIKRAIASVEAQSFKSFELLVVNDRSTDKTIELVNEDKSKRLLLINSEGKGVSAARNTGLKNANGKYILFLDDDDELCDEALQKIYDELSEQAFPEVMRFGGKRQKDDGEYLCIKPTGRLSVVYPAQKKQILGLLFGKKRIDCYVWLLCVKNKGIKAFDESLAYLEDEVFYIDNMTRADERICFCDVPIYLYCFNKNSKTKSTENFLRNMNDILDANKVKKSKLEKLCPELIAVQECDAYQLVLLKYHYFLKKINKKDQNDKLRAFSAIIRKNYSPRLLIKKPKLFLRIILLAHNVHLVEKAIIRIRHD